MLEPLNTPFTEKKFVGRSSNRHPHFTNVPLRLNQAERKEPFLAIDEFFQCFHLQDVREILWTWMVEIISSPHSVSNDHHARNNHVYFYEKIEELVEAAFVAHRKRKKYQRKKSRSH